MYAEFCSVICHLNTVSLRQLESSVLIVQKTFSRWTFSDWSTDAAERKRWRLSYKSDGKQTPYYKLTEYKVFSFLPCDHVRCLYLDAGVFLLHSSCQRFPSCYFYQSGYNNARCHFCWHFLLRFFTDVAREQARDVKLCSQIPNPENVSVSMKPLWIAPSAILTYRSGAGLQKKHWYVHTCTYHTDISTSVHITFILHVRGLTDWLWYQQAEVIVVELRVRWMNMCKPDTTGDLKETSGLFPVMFVST